MAGINLHAVVRSAITAVHPDEDCTLYQSLGQKNTVFAIWMGYTFFTPVTAVAGGFYSVWHNIVNSWQLYRQRKREEAEEAMNRE